MFKIAVILFVRMWVEIFLLVRGQEFGNSHPLREDVSWNYYIITARIVHASSSSWGCELKYRSELLQHYLFHRHPLREDVSWNDSLHHLTFPLISHPLREDVSWNIRYDANLAYCPVILFVRMWVEILKLLNKNERMGTSSSSWGCELKCYRISGNLYRKRSSSSWGCELKWRIYSTRIRSFYVILFVRMWVEMVLFGVLSPGVLVILFVRMWVEIISARNTIL